MATEFAILGGDLRNVKLMEILAESGNKVYTYGLLPITETPNTFVCRSAETAASWAEIVIGPVPLHVGTVKEDEILQALSPGKIFIGGKIPESLISGLKQKGVLVVDILQREDMAILNAVPTAEGAIQVAMEKLPVTIDGCKVLIAGFGKVAKALASRVDALGGKVTICARKNRDLAWATNYGYKGINFSELRDKISEYRVIYNTVPALIFDKLLLEEMKKAPKGNSPLLIDLASQPGGIDFGAANKSGIETVQALSLPGKVAPETAALNMAKVIYNIIKEITEEAAENVN